MLEIISNAEAKAHLRIDGTADDAWLATMIPAVQSAVTRWVGGEARLQDEEGEVIPCVETAVLVELAYQYAHREGPVNLKTMEWYGHGYTLSAGATAMLQSVRKPTVA